MHGRTTPLHLTALQPLSGHTHTHTTFVCVCAIDMDPIDMHYLYCCINIMWTMVRNAIPC